MSVRYGSAAYNAELEVVDVSAERKGVDDYVSRVERGYDVLAVGHASYVYRNDRFRKSRNRERIVQRVRMLEFSAAT
jgi:hypothetical protein